jgi:hypothetical protein
MSDRHEVDVNHFEPVPCYLCASVIATDAQFMRTRAGRPVCLSLCSPERRCRYPGCLRLLEDYASEDSRKRQLCSMCQGWLEWEHAESHRAGKHATEQGVAIYHDDCVWCRHSLAVACTSRTA